MDTQTITKAQLEAVMRRWAQDSRDGKTRSQEETDALPLEQVAAEQAAYVWGELAASPVTTESAA